MLWTIEFWKGAGERAIKTFAQALVASFVITAPVVEQPWLVALGTAATATLISFLTSVGNADFVAGDGTVADTEPVYEPDPTEPTTGV